MAAWPIIECDPRIPDTQIRTREGCQKRPTAPATSIDQARVRVRVRVRVGVGVRPQPRRQAQQQHARAPVPRAPCTVHRAPCTAPIHHPNGMKEHSRGSHPANGRQAPSSDATHGFPIPESAPGKGARNAPPPQPHRSIRHEFEYEYEYEQEWEFGRNLVDKHNNNTPVPPCPVPRAPCPVLRAPVPRAPCTVHRAPPPSTIPTG
jgi:hypothetical protein